MNRWTRSSPEARGARSRTDAVLCAVPRMRPGTVLGCCVSLLVAGVMLARGFVGIAPSRPVYLVLGGILAGTALLGLVVDHVSVVVRADRPDHVLVSELERSRRFGHALTLLSVRCDEGVGLDVVSHLRTTDRAWREGGLLYVLLVETGTDGAAAFADRLTRLVPPDHVRVATFPDDAMTSWGLRAALAPPHGAPEAVPTPITPAVGSVDEAARGLIDLGATPRLSEG